MVCDCTCSGTTQQRKSCLNPCSNGRWSATAPVLEQLSRENHVLILVLMVDGLRLGPKFATELEDAVLILVLMVDGLRLFQPQLSHNQSLEVLILVLMVDGLRRKPINRLPYSYWSLNPCSNGRWSATTGTVVDLLQSEGVLILVLMVDGLRQSLSFC